ncbi:GFA family protein [Pseudothioclava arenosa]|uniref:Aldehyde-activating protein n=1 Tax=Pseudothioclava arenosa TaxID=1795308 RepID=A0A2A4CPF9_9RHOB|nr:GFA family protein [Pseudothioclava arenosa]PCD76132.1 aldehyde-activating protein [Pseudothioclava arenosa]
MNDANNWQPLPAFTGSCQCGAVRYTVAPGPSFASICHCRMCQRATGSPFAALLKVATDRVTWQGEPGVFQSSGIAARGFCSACGTPLFYRKTGSDWIEFTSGSHPADLPFTPVRQWGLEARHDWLSGLAIPGAETVERDLISYQSKDE